MRLKDLKRLLDEAAANLGDEAVVGVIVTDRSSEICKDIQRVIHINSNFTRADVIIIASESENLHKTK